MQLLLVEINVSFDLCLFFLFLMFAIRSHVTTTTALSLFLSLSPAMKRTKLKNQFWNEKSDEDERVESALTCSVQRFCEKWLDVDLVDLAAPVDMTGWHSHTIFPATYSSSSSSS